MEPQDLSKAAVRRARDLTCPQPKGHRQLVGSGQPDLGGWKMSQGLTLPNAADFRPEVEALAPGSSVLGGSDMAAADIKQVIDLIVG